MKLHLKKDRAAKKPKSAQSRAARKKRLYAGGYSAAAIVIVIAIAVAANLLACAVPADMTQLDLTDQSLYTLSEQTRRVAASLDQDVTLYLLANTGSEDPMVVTLLERYEALSDHIRMEHVDPVEQPTFLDRYDLDIMQLYANSVLVSCGDTVRLVGYDEIFVTDYSMDYYSYSYDATTTFEGENALTNAIHYVSRDDLPKVYTLVGHGEQALGENVTGMIEQDNMTSENLSLLMIDSVPEDASAVVINAPTDDISAEEADMLIAYMENGGSVMLLTDYIAAGEMENLMRVAASMGMAPGEGVVVEGNQNRHLNRYPYYLLPYLGGHAITDPLVEGGYYVLAALCQPIVETGDTDALVMPLLTTTDDAYSKAAALEMTTTDKEEGDGEGPFNVAAIGETGEGKLMWVTSAELLSGSLDRMVSGGNSDLFMNALSYMVGQQETISIRAKSLENRTLTLTGAQSAFWSAVMIGVIPGMLALAGILIVMRRKRQ